MNVPIIQKVKFNCDFTAYSQSAYTNRFKWISNPWTRKYGKNYFKSRGNQYFTINEMFMYNIWDE